jgi:hypothetical protein
LVLCTDGVDEVVVRDGHLGGTGGEFRVVYQVDREVSRFAGGIVSDAQRDSPSMVTVLLIGSTSVASAS